MLYDQAVLPNAKGIDSGLGGFCKRHEYGWNSCLAVYPMLTGVHKPAGDMTKDSDRRKVNSGGNVREVPESDHLVYSIRLNIEALLTGKRVIKAQHQMEAMKGYEEIDPETLLLPKGYPVAIKSDQYIKAQ